MFLIIGIILVCVLGAVALRRPSSDPVAANKDSLLSSLAGSFARSDVPVRPEASPWSKQVAVDMLNEVVIADEREKVLNMLRRAVQTPEANTGATPANSTSGSSSAVKQPIA
jgi:hypothetical protein